MCELTLSEPKVNKSKPVYTTMDYLIHQLNKVNIQSLSYKKELDGTIHILVSCHIKHCIDVKEILSNQNEFSYTINATYY
jgi:hypothetical protein